jgi:hypothetical protein
MVLWTNVTGGCIENKANRRGVLQTVAYKLTATSPRLPLRNFVPILEAGVENIYGTTGRMQASEMAVADK